jgi:hypothetical protein
MAFTFLSSQRFQMAAYRVAEFSLKGELSASSTDLTLNSYISSVDFGFGSYHFQAQSTNVAGTVQAFYVYLNDNNEVRLTRSSLVEACIQTRIIFQGRYRTFEQRQPRNS